MTLGMLENGAESRERKQACNHCYQACLHEEDVSMMKACIELDRECAEICAFAAQAIYLRCSLPDCRICGCA